MKVLEQFIAGKGGAGRPCEDAIYVGPAFAAVIDGATAKGARRFGGVSSGLFATRSIQASLDRLDPQASIAEFSAALGEGLARDIARDAPGSGPGGRDGPSATIVAYSVARREIWRIGDASWAVDGTAHVGGKAIDDIGARARAAFLRAHRLHGTSLESLMADDPGRALILPLLGLQHAFRNLDDPDEPLAFGAIDGRPVPQRYLECWPVPGARELVLASDGYPRLFATLDETEAYLQAELARDPLRMGVHASTKGIGPGMASFDDRAFLRFATAD